MPKSIHIFLFLVLVCSFLVVFYYTEIEKNVVSSYWGRFGSQAFGSNLRHLRALTGAEGAKTKGSKNKLTPSSLDENSYNITSVVHRLGNANNLDDGDSSSSTEAIHLAVIFCNAGQHAPLERNFRKMLNSLFRFCSPKANLHFHLVTDPDSWDAGRNVIDQEALLAKLSVKVSAYFIGNFSSSFSETIEVLQQYFSAKPGTYYSQALFYVSVRLSELIPATVDRLTFVDVDTEFRDGLEKLVAYFDDFDNDQLLGLAPELSPVYRHILYLYRHRHKSTLLGEPKGHGFPGYNSGVVLMKLGKIRQSSLFASLLTNSTLSSLTTKYSFKGHLGDQDFYTLAALEHPELFYTLPCNWNRQLCQWWRSKGYDDVFDKFYECQGSISLYHGNCNSRIP